MAFERVPRESGIEGISRRCNVQACKLLPLPLQGLYRALQGHYSALQRFSAIARRQNGSRAGQKWHNSEL